MLTVTARDAAGNTSTDVVTVTYTPPALPGPVAAYAFDEGAGTTLGDVSGNALNGAVSGATWTTQGRYGGALSFDGVNDRVNVPDATLLDLTNAMTLEAWVYPTALSGWRTVLMKESPSGLAYVLYAHDDVPRPAGYVRVGSDQAVTGTAALPLNAWTHVALTYDGATLRFFQNGVQVGSRALTGSMAATTLPLTIGGNAPWGEYFAGRIDDVRVYSRALSAAEIATDMNTAAGGVP